MQQRMKHQANKHRSERVFSVNDEVFLKLQPYLQSLVQLRVNQKLAFKYFGPFRVLARVCAVQTCRVCQQAKPERTMPGGLLQILPIPSGPRGWLPWTS
jgi:hypothetical protein